MLLMQLHNRGIIQLHNVNFACIFIVTHIYKTITINYNTYRVTELTKRGYKLSTCLKY